MIHLLDVNVLVALGWPNHQHHYAAERWLAGHLDEGWATCPFTEVGFIRLSINPRIADPVATAPEAVDLLRRMTTKGVHAFWPEVRSVLDAQPDMWLSVRGHKQVPDAYLVRLATHHGGRVATFDQAMALAMPEHAVSIPV